MKRRSYAMLRAAAALAVLVVASPAWAELRGEVVRIIDGDTIDVLVDKQPVRVRLVDIDAPEKRQAFGERARQALAGMVFRRHVLVDEKDTDRYGRTLGTVWVNMELASVGWWSYWRGGAGGVGWLEARRRAGFRRRRVKCPAK
ncbi:TPA: thermonuclease family protein [Pseudomonas aeruginosa]